MTPKQQRLKRLPADPYESIRRTSGNQLLDFSKTPLRECNQQCVRSSILALRRGPIRYHRNKMIVLEGDPTDYVYLVATGVVRSCRTYGDGGRRVVAFHFAGELFGLTGGPIHSLSAEAATDALILFFKRSALLVAANRNRKIANFMLAATTNQLRTAQEHSLLLTRRAECRVAAFLIDLSTRMGQSNHLDMPMSHHDIADHLGMTGETFSRSLSALERSGSIARTSWRKIFLRSRAALERIIRN